MTITLELSQEEEQLLRQLATKQGRKAEEIALEAVMRVLPPPKREYTPEELEESDRYVLACTVSAPYAIGADNESIDADLLKAYSDDHAPVSVDKEQAA